MLIIFSFFILPRNTFYLSTMLNTLRLCSSKMQETDLLGNNEQKRTLEIKNSCYN